jgi:hypothetical protein
MKFRFFLTLCLALAASLSFSQEVTQAGKDVDTVLLKISKLNIVKYVTPLLLKKSQINALMTTIEKCQSKQKEIVELDAKEFKSRKLDVNIDKALDEALNEGSYPKRELQAEIIKVQDALLVRRQIATTEMVSMLLDTCKKNLNEGQMVVMRNLTDPNYVEGQTKASKLSDDEKTKLYIREVLLSPLTYDILKQLAKHAQ